MKTKLFIVSIVILLLMFTIKFTSFAKVTTSNVSYTFSPNYMEIQNGTQNAVSIKMMNAQNLVGTELAVSYDPKMVKIVDLVPNATGLFPLSIGSKTIDNARGIASLGIVSTPGRTANGSGVIVSITYEAQTDAKGKTLVKFKSARYVQKNIFQYQLGTTSNLTVNIY